MHKKRLTDLGLGMMRMHIGYKILGDPTSPLVCHGSGCATSVSGDSWISGIKAVGAEPIVIITADATRTTQQDQTDAVNLLKHFNKDTNNPIKYWIIGNELDNSGNAAHMDATTYANRFNSIYDAMKAVDPSIKIGGPATAYYDTNYFDTFLTLSGNKTDFIDFHTYGQGGTEDKSEATLLSETMKYTTDLQDLRSRIQQKVPARANAIGMHVGEWNLDWNSDPKQYTQFTTVWAASALGRIIAEGGNAMAYADKNGALGLLYETTSNGGSKNDPMPIYHAYGMFTGEGLFPHFGTTLVTATTTLPNVEVYASDNPKQLVIVNKNPTGTQTATLSLPNLPSGSVAIWRKDTSMSTIAPPLKIETRSFTASSLSLSLPAYSVTTLVFSTTSLPSPTVTTGVTTQFVFSMLLHGIGHGGDNINPDSIGTFTPLHPERPLTVELFNTANQPVNTFSATAAYNTASGVFVGTGYAGVAPGVYTVKLSTPGYLHKVIPGIVSVTARQQVTLPQVALTAGDSTHDNLLSILDYNLILDCFSDLSPARNCADTTKKQATDITDDGSVNQFDYNLFLRELSVQSGQ